MFKLLLLIGLIVIFNILSRKISNMDQANTSVGEPTSDNDLDAVWDNLERLAKDRKQDTTSTTASLKSGKVSVKRSPNSYQGKKVYNTDKGYFEYSGTTSEPKKKEVKKPVVETSFTTDTFAPLSKEEMVIPKKEVLPKADKVSYDYASLRDLAEENSQLSVKNFTYDEISVDDLANQDVSKSETLSFDSDSVLKGIIFSEILGKPKSKSKNR